MGVSRLPFATRYSLPLSVDSYITTAWLTARTSRYVWFQAFPPIVSVDPVAYVRFRTWYGTFSRLANAVTIFPFGVRLTTLYDLAWDRLEHYGGPPFLRNATGGVLLPFDVPIPYR